jgi:hypothetical protein
LSFSSRIFAAAVLTVALAASLQVAQPAAIAAASASGDAADSVNLITNGSFESPSIWQSNSVVEYDAGSTAMPGWTVGGNSVDLVGESYWQAEDGDQSVDLSGSAPGSVSQTVSPGFSRSLTAERRA